MIDNRRRHVPSRIDGDEFHIRRHDRRRHFRLADHDPGHPHQFVVVHHPQCEVGQINDDISVGKLVRHPAPALHIGEDDVDRLVGLLAV